MINRQWHYSYQALPELSFQPFPQSYQIQRTLVVVIIEVFVFEFLLLDDSQVHATDLLIQLFAVAINQSLLFIAPIGRIQPQPIYVAPSISWRFHWFPLVPEISFHYPVLYSQLFYRYLLHSRFLLQQHRQKRLLVEKSRQPEIEWVLGVIEPRSDESDSFLEVDQEQRQ